jgi:hypothetical protein
MRFLIIVIVALLAAYLERSRGTSLADGIERTLGSRWMPLLVGLVWAGLVWWTWGEANPQPIFHDEIAYVFQAKLFAAGRWTAPAPPMADFFAQPYLLVDPVMASKYPPGHSLMLAPGALLGAPFLMVLVMHALRGAMVFVLARRLSSATIAFATCLFLMHGDSIHWAGSFFSETTTGALLPVCWYALLRWHETPRARWIVLVAASLGWCAITRPFSAVLFAIPIAVVVLRDVFRTRRWRDLGLAMATGTAIVAILPLWASRTTGDWRLWPVTVYTRDYMPYDHPHFGVDTATPRREPPSDLAGISASLMQEERNHTVARLPQIALSRVPYFADATWWDSLLEAPLAVVGLLAAPAAIWVGVGTVVAIFVGYLTHPTWAAWTIYYMEVAPVLVFLAVVGFAQLLRRMARRKDEPPHWRSMPRAPVALMVGCFFSVLVLVGPESSGERAWHGMVSAYQKSFRGALAQVPGPSVLFVRYATWHSPHFILVANNPDWPSERVWIVRDRGDVQNAELLRRAPDRRAFLYRETSGRIDAYRPTGAHAAR